MQFVLFFAQLLGVFVANIQLGHGSFGRSSHKARNGFREVIFLKSTHNQRHHVNLTLM